MTRTILKNAAGEEKSVDELRQLIRTTYGIEPAKSLDQMLYKRASAGRGFYKTTEGKFGLTELRMGVAIDDVPLSSTTQPPWSKFTQISRLARAFLNRHSNRGLGYRIGMHDGASCQARLSCFNDMGGCDVERLDARWSAGSPGESGSLSLKPPTM